MVGKHHLSMYQANTTHLTYMYLMWTRVHEIRLFQSIISDTGDAQHPTQPIEHPTTHCGTLARHCAMSTLPLHGPQTRKHAHKSVLVM